MLEVLTENSIQWKTNLKNEFLNFPRTGLSSAFRIWHYFISSILNPSTHGSSISKERAILNFAIAKGINFDVEHVIESSIIEATNGKCTGGITHPSTITMLCKIAGVQF